MEDILIDKISIPFKNTLPISVYFVKGITKQPFVNKELKFAKSNFYNTKKMACYNFYKPSFLRKTNDE
jgi:hypothetical protein